ncbi:histidine kinase [Saccharopolyspora sp. NFXS83]|uniref:sensor histidine kinase n=1 Tax=Saccharopolyspora sp. NFXS83 TaxID=2993560 RepID=UPI00224AB09D|nr:histidine kinase [Saccharopolyspora sp. NFXS83]MCX2731994.1 histidine kinase [Saccharopolyspora sp. NFXS83]
MKRVPSAVAAEADRIAAAARAAPRRTVVLESLCFVLLLAEGLFTPLFVLLDPWSLPVGIPFAVFAAALVPARRWWPAGALLATSVLGAGGSLAAPLIASVVVAFTAARRVRWDWRLWSAVLITAVVKAVLMVLAGDQVPFGQLVAVLAVSLSVELFIPMIAGALLGARQPLVRLLRERNDYLEQARHLTAEQARSTERASIAGEMHDMLGHRLSLLSLHAGALELSAAKETPKLGEQATFVRTTAGQALTELREILGVLRSGTGEHEALDERSGCRADIERLVAESRAVGMPVSLHWRGIDLDGADPRTRHAVHRIVREGLTNAHKHAPGASVVVEVTGADRILVRVGNGPGEGPNRAAPGLRSGLAGLEERARMLGGELAGASGSDGGFSLTAELPARPPMSAPRPEIAPVQEPPPVLDADVLTLPRALGAGCLMLLLGLLLLVTVVVLVAAAFAGGLRFVP